MTGTRKLHWKLAVFLGAAFASVLGAIWSWPLLSEEFHRYMASRPVACIPMNQEELSKRQPIKDIVSADVGGMGKFEYQSKFPGMGKVHPHVAIMAFDGWLLGGDQGEFGGGIVYERYDHPQLFLSNENVEDIFRMSFGYVVTTRYVHLMGDDSIGSLILVTQNGSAPPTARKIYDLPAAASTSWLLESGDLLINTGKGSVVLGQDRSLKPIKCLPRAQPDA